MNKRIIISLLTLAILGAVFILPVHVGAESAIAAGAISARGDGQPVDLFGDSGIFKTISSTLLYLVGAISVLMIIFGGVRYVLSGGNSASVTAAKNTILYAIVGVIVALVAYALINFVLTTLISGTSGASNL